MLLTITKRLKIYIDILILSRTLYMDIYVEVRWGLKRCLEVGVGRVGSRGRTLIRDPRVTTNKQVLKGELLALLSFILVCGFLQFTTVVKSVSLQSLGCKYLSVKTANAHIFLTVNRK